MIKSKKLRYSYPQEVFQEIPGELTLALSISGCNLHCKGCHSSETWDPNFGKILDINELEMLLNKHISCVLFYGGEWNIKELTKMLVYVKAKGLKTALYTGRESDYFDEFDEVISNLNYIKVGRYIEKLGGLKSPETNQRIIKLR